MLFYSNCWDSLFLTIFHAPCLYNSLHNWSASCETAAAAADDDDDDDNWSSLDRRFRHSERLGLRIIIVQLILRLHDRADIEQTSSKHQAGLMEPRPLAQM